MKGIFLLFKFMTRLPLPFGSKFDSDRLGRSMKYFPVVGLVIGAILSLGYILMINFIPSFLLIAVLITIFEVILTGGLHLDGLADTFDGIFSYRSKQKMLEIMKDSRLGSNGGIVLILYFILKIALLTELFNMAVYKSVVVLMVYPMLSRLGSVLNCAFEPYAKSTGMGKTFVDNTKISGAILAMIITLAMEVVLSWYFRISLFFFIPITFIIVIVDYILGKLITRKIGGVTGDTLGAIVEFSELLVLFITYLLIV